MTSRTSTFQVKFTTDGSGNVKADIESVAKAAVDGSKQVNSEGGKNWEEYGRKIGTAIRYAGAAVVAGAALIIKNTMDAQRELAQLDAVLLSTGNAAGYTRDQLVAMAEGIAQASTFSAGEITKAETRLLSYSGIAGTIFPQALQVAIDQAARLGMGLEQSAEAIGRALESPTKAAAALAQQGFGAAFTKSVRDAIKALEDAGDAAGAQQIVVDILNESYKGAAEAARNTLGGALEALKNNFNDLMTGDGGGEGVVGTTAAINDLNATMSSAETKEAFGSMTAGLFSIGAAAAEALVWLTKLNAERMKQFGFAPDASGGTRNAGPADMVKGWTSGMGALLKGDWQGAQAGADRAYAGAWGGRIADFSDVNKGPKFLFSDTDEMPASFFKSGTGKGAAGGGGGSEAKVKKAKKELTEFEKLMADIGVYEQIWGEAAVDASNAKVDAWEKENEEQKRRSEIAADVLLDIQLETEAMGMSSEQIEIRNNLLRAGVDAESERGQAIVDATKQLQESRETWQTINDLQDITTDFATSAVMNFGNAGDAVEDFGKRLTKMATQLLMEKAVQYIFGAFFGTAGTNGGEAQGGLVDLYSGGFGVATGGKIYGPGTRTSDSIPARLSRDEWVINADASSYYGDDMMASINAKTFATGGPVNGFGGNAAAGMAGMSGIPAIEFNVTNNAPDAEVGEPTARFNEYGKLVVDMAVSKMTDGLARKGSTINKAMRAGLEGGARYG